ncbi:MAG: hypothetical protein ABEN55_21950 [Bradymonadaceae bacterium]
MAKNLAGETERVSDLRCLGPPPVERVEPGDQFDTGHRDTRGRHGCPYNAHCAESGVDPLPSPDTSTTGSDTGTGNHLPWGESDGSSGCACSTEGSDLPTSGRLWGLLVVVGLVRRSGRL